MERTYVFIDKDAENVFKQIALNLGFNVEDYENTEEVYRVKKETFNKLIK